MTESSASNDSYVEPPLSQLEIPYKMNFSSPEDKRSKKRSKKEKNTGKRALFRSKSSNGDVDNSDDSSSSSSSSSCASFDSHPERKVKNREPLRVNDIIAYTPPVYTAGTNVRQAAVLGIWPSEKSFPLILDNAEMLPWGTRIQRVGEFYDGQIYKHGGRMKPLSSFRLQQGGTKDVTVGLKEKASDFKQMLNDIQQRAMATLRGEINSPLESQYTGVSNGRVNAKQPAVSSSRTKLSNLSNGKPIAKGGDDVPSSSSDSSTGIYAPRMDQGRGKQSLPLSPRRPAATDGAKKTSGLRKPKKSSSESNAFSSSSSSDDSVPLEKLAVKKPRGYKSKRLSLSKTNTLVLPKSLLGTGRPQPKSISKPKAILQQPPSRKETIKVVNKSIPRSAKGHPIAVDDSSDESFGRNGTGKKTKSFMNKQTYTFPPTTITTLNEDSDSDVENGPSPKGLMPKHIESVLQNHRAARPSIQRGETVLWSGTDTESDEITAGIDKTLERKRKRRKVLRGKDTLGNLKERKENDSFRATSGKFPRAKTTTTSNGRVYSNKELDIGSSSSDESIENLKTAKKKEPKLPSPQGRVTDIMQGLGSDDSSDDDLLIGASPFGRQNTKKQSPKKENLSNTTNQNKKDVFPCYDADEDSENDETLLAKPVWFHNHSSERKVKSPSPSKSQRKRSQVPHSERKAFPKSPSNRSRSRLVQDIRRQKMLSPSPTPRKNSQQPLRFELSPSSNDNSNDSVMSIQKTEHAKNKRSDWSSESSVDSPPEEEYFQSPSPRHKKQESSKRSIKQHRLQLGKKLDFSSNDDVPKSNFDKVCKTLSPFSRRNNVISSNLGPKSARGSSRGRR